MRVQACGMRVHEGLGMWDEVTGLGMKDEGEGMTHGG